MPTPGMQAEITIRDANLDDRDFVLATVKRLANYGPPPWRTVDEIIASERRGLQEFFDRPESRGALFIAERSDQGRLGYVYLEVKSDYFTQKPSGHISSVAVIENRDGQGIGSALM